MRRDPGVLTSRCFLAGLLLLLANDFFFKPLFHNWLTGKLSDFAGLFIFPLFWVALVPRCKKAIYLTTALAFVFWKSARSQALIDAWGSWTGWHVTRQVDASDTLALSALVPSYLYHSSFIRRPSSALLSQHVRKFATGGALLLAVFAFAATSYRTAYDYDNQEFAFADSRAGLIQRFKRLPHRINHSNYWSSHPAPDEYTINVKADFCFDGLDALVEIKEQDASHSRLVLRKLEHQCPESAGDKEKMLSIFQHELIEKLQADVNEHAAEVVDEPVNPLQPEPDSSPARPLRGNVSR